MSTYVRHQEITHEVGETGRVGIKVADADLRLRGVPGGEARLRATFEINARSDEEADEVLSEVGLRVQSGAGWLEIRDERDSERLGASLRRLITGRLGAVSLSIEGEIPFRAETTLETASGDLVLEGLTGSQRVTTVSGDVYATETAGDLRVTTVSGDATLRGVDSLNLSINAVSGDLSVSAPLVRTFRANTVSGDVDLEGRLDRDGDFRVETVSGDVEVGLLGSATFEVRGLSSDVHVDVDHRLEGPTDRRRVIIGDGSPVVRFSSMSGDLRIRPPRRIEAPPAPPAPPAVAPPPAPVATAGEEPNQGSASLDVLRALERGEIDVDEAARRLGGGS